MKKLVFILAMLLSISAIADVVTVGGFSHHTKRKGQNEVHNTIGYSRDGYEIMTFNNSFDVQSVSLTYNLQSNFDSDIEFGLRVGATTGYANHGIKMPIAPVVHPNVTFWYDRIGIEVGFLPLGMFCKNCSDVLTFSGKYRF